MTENFIFKKLQGFCKEVREERLGIVVVLALFLQSVFRASIFFLYGLLIGRLRIEYDTPMLQLTMIGVLPNFFQNVFSFVPIILIRRIGRNGEMWMAVASALLIIVGLLTSSFVPSPQWMFLTYSFILGCGYTFGHVNGFLITSFYFPKGHKHHVLALTINSFSSQIGNLMISLLAWMISTLGWRITLRALAAGHFCILLPLCLLFKTSKKNDLNSQTIELVVSKKDNEESLVSDNLKDNNDHMNYQAINQDEDDLIVSQGTENSTNNQENLDSTTNDSQVEATEDSQGSRSLKLSNILQQAGQRWEIIFWWVSVVSFAVVYYGATMLLPNYFESFGYTMLEASYFISITSIAGFIVNVLGCVMGGILDGRLIYVNIVSSICLSIVTLIWSLLHGGKYYHFAMSCLFGTFNAMNRIYIYPCSHEVTGLEFEVAISSTMVFIGIGSIITPFFTGGILDIFRSYKACFFSISTLCLIDFVNCCLAALYNSSREN